MFMNQIFELAGVSHMPKAKHLLSVHKLIEGYKEAQAEFTEVASEGQAQRTIDQFRDLVDRNQVQGNERNIDYWRKQGWQAFSAFVSTKSQQTSKTQEKRSKVPGKSITVYEDAKWLVVVPLDKEASCYHGKNTDWCTTKHNRSHYEDYFHNNGITLIYFLKLDTGDKWAIAYSENASGLLELFDKNDNQITDTQFTEQTGFDPKVFVQKVKAPNNYKEIAASRAEYQAARERLRVLSPFKDLPPDTNFDQIERDLWLVKSGMYIIRYCTNVKGRWPKIEKLISSDLDYAVAYAKKVIKGRWPEIEQRLLDSEDGLHMAVEYAADVIKGSWPELEKRLQNEPHLAIMYALEASKRRLPDTMEQSVLMRASNGDRNEYREFFM